MTKKYYNPEKNLKIVKAMVILFTILGVPYAWAIMFFVWNNAIFLILMSFVAWPLFMYAIYWVIKRG